MKAHKPIKLQCAVWEHGELTAFIRGLLKCHDAYILEKTLTTQYNCELQLLNSARSAIFLILQQLKKQFPQKDKVLVPAFICDSVPETVRATGLKVVKVGVSKDLNICPIALEALIDSDCIAVIMPHMYGAIADINAFVDLCKVANVTLIDDAAQVTGICSDGKPLGTFGDFGVLSFAQAKSVVTGVRGSGGVLLNNCGLTMPACPEYYCGWTRLSALWHFWAQYYKKGHWATFEYYRCRLLHKLGRKPVNYYPVNTAISHAEAAIALVQLKSLPRQITQTELKANRCFQLVKELSNISVPQWHKGPCYLTRLVIQSKIIAPQELQQLLAIAAIDSKLVYSNGSRPYDGNFDSGLLELPWVNINIADETNLFRQLAEIELNHR